MPLKKVKLIGSVHEEKVFGVKKLGVQALQVVVKAEDYQKSGSEQNPAAPAVKQVCQPEVNAQTYEAQEA
jgi:hypothetical protein